MKKERRVELREKLEQRYKYIGHRGANSKSGLDVVTALCLLEDLEKAETALEALVKHWGVVCGGEDTMAAKMSGVMHIATEALKEIQS